MIKLFVMLQSNFKLTCFLLISALVICIGIQAQDPFKPPPPTPTPVVINPTPKPPVTPKKGPFTSISIQADHDFYFSLNDSDPKKVTKGQPERIKLDADVHKLEFEEDDSTGERIERYFRMTPEMVKRKFDTIYTVKFQKDFAQIIDPQKKESPPSPPVKPPPKQFDQKVETIAIELRNDMLPFEGAGSASSSLYVGKHEVTQRQWQQVMDNNKSAKQNCAECPVENITWNDAMAFIEKLNQNSNTKFRLPMAAEWDFVARKIDLQEVYSPNLTQYQKNLKAFAERTSFHNKSKNSGPQEVGKKEAAGSLYDLYGNVAEWCADSDKPGEKKAIRGGSFLDKTKDLRPEEPDAELPSGARKSLGFRLVADAN